MEKKRIIKDYNKLSQEFKRELLKSYPHGFSRSAVSYIDRNGRVITVIHYDTPDISYLIKIPLSVKTNLIKKTEKDEMDIIHPDFRHGFSEEDIDPSEETDTDY